jgi:serine/threonine protein phosphatase PrpC
MPNCPSCDSEAVPGANFCGRCGAKLATLPEPPVARCRCGAGSESIDAAGFCNECGVRQIDASPRDHEEHVIDANFGAVTDRGRRHAVNEDAVFIADATNPKGPIRLLVVCDGVSTSIAAAQASASAVEAFGNTVRAAVARGDDLADAAMQAARAAQDAVVALPYHDADNAPAATLVAAVVCERRAVIVWAGDSRAYMLTDTPVQLTRDHSWFNDVVERGVLTPAQARRHKYAHAIVNSLGGLTEGGEFAPSLIDTVLPEGAGILLCSDGLWNYADSPEEIGKLACCEGDAIEVCRQLVAFANRQGGHDNISVVLLRPNAAISVRNIAEDAAG